MTHRKSFLVFAVLIVFVVSSLSVFAAPDPNYTMHNFGGYIFSAVPTSDNWQQCKIDNPQFIYRGIIGVNNRDYSPVETFTWLCLRAGGYQFGSRKTVNSQFDAFAASFASFSRKYQFQAEAISNFFKTSLYYTPRDGYLVTPVVTFSSDFRSFIDFVTSLFFEANQIDRGNFDMSVFPVRNSELWIEDRSSIAFYFDDCYHPTSESLDIEYIHFTPVVYDIEGAAGTTLSQIFKNLVSFIDIRNFTSWLPSIISSQIVSYWGIFLTLAGVLVALKILHG